MTTAGSIAWSDIETALETLQRADGGFSSAHRGIVTLANGKQVFVKIGVDDNTRAWAKKEIAVYHFLQKHGYPYIPRLLAVNEGETAFALELLDKVVGWDWSETWTKARLDKTLEAMDALAVITPEGVDKTYFEHAVIDASDNGWRPLADSTDKQQILLAKLRSSGYTDTAEALDFEVMTQKSEQYTFTNDQLVHNDIRADNGAWNAKTNEVKLVDWNWMQFGDRRLDLSAMLTHVQKSGFNLLPDYASRLDADALQWMAGFWFNSAVKPIWPGGPEHLRDHQLKAGVTALELSRKMQRAFASKLATYGITPDNSVIIGSGILSALGLRQSSDIDITVADGVYEKLKADSHFKEMQTHGRSVLVFENLEIGTNWGVLGKDQKLDDLMKESVVIDDVRYVSLDFLLAVKKSWLQDDDVRQKDIDDVKLVEDYKASPRMGVTIEKAQPQDAEAITEVQAITWLATYPNAELGITAADIRMRLEGDHGERTTRRIEQWRDSIESGSNQGVYVARINGEVVGFTLSAIDPEGQHRIGAVYVLPEAQGKGVGSQLMKESLAWHGDGHPICLTVAAYNQNAINFYKKFGFQKTDKQVVDLPARKRGLKEIPEIEMMRPALEKS